ncbi:MAG: DNA adenine methylase [Chitinophagales bacterium]|nr:DNA adenine methylase [Chitinophagales bacterium]
MQVIRYLPMLLLLVKTPNNGLAGISLHYGEDQQGRKKLANKRDSFTEDYAIRLQNVSLECTDALRIISSRDSKNTFVYADPPYYNSDMGHYDGYTISDFEALLKLLSNMEGKFMLSSYPSPILADYTTKKGWNTHQYEMSIAVTGLSSKPKRKKVEVITTNY